MKKRNDLEQSCSLCEYSLEIFGGDYYICKKKGVVDPCGLCRSFCFDPWKIKVSVRKIPKFTPLTEMMNFPELNQKKEEAK